jgi:hypothetical protein
MACVNQTQPHCVNQMGKIQSNDLAEQHGRGTAGEQKRNGRETAWERHGNGMACVNQTQPHCVNQMGKTQSNDLVERHGRGTAWEQQGEWQGNGMVTAWYV